MKNFEYKKNPNNVGAFDFIAGFLCIRTFLLEPRLYCRDSFLVIYKTNLHTNSLMTNLECYLADLLT